MISSISSVHFMCSLMRFCVLLQLWAITAFDKPLLADFFHFMAVTISGLSEWFVTNATLKRHFIIVYTEMITKIAKFREFKRTFLALQDLVHSFSVLVQSMNQVIVSFVLHFVKSSHFWVIILVIVNIFTEHSLVNQAAVFLYSFTVVVNHW